MSDFQYGILGKDAPQLNLNTWFDGKGEKTPALQLKKNVVTVLYCFQSWCPGCHSRGFPTIQALVKKYAQQSEQGAIQFAVAQTVFEGHAQNGVEKLRETQLQYDLDIPFAQDQAKPRPQIMRDYRTGGTPWIIIINQDQKVVFNDFHIDLNQAYKILDAALKNSTHKVPETMDYIAENETKNNRYVVKLENGLEAFLRYRKEDNVLYLDHAEVPSELRGQSYGAVLMEATLEKIEAEGLKVIPVCSYTQMYLRRYKRWAHLLA